jgi:hypothetical protein
MLAYDNVEQVDVDCSGEGTNNNKCTLSLPELDSFWEPLCIIAIFYPLHGRKKSDSMLHITIELPFSPL